MPVIFPEVFDGRVMGFFTDRELGIHIQGLTGRRVYLPRQEHTDTVIVLEKDLDATVGDAVLTDRHDIMLGIQTADCVPILLFDRVRRVVGAVHAGWRGTAKGILKKTVETMGGRFDSDPRDVIVAMGPAIRWCCYDVAEDVVEAVRQATGNDNYHKVEDGKNCLDLQSANAAQALSAGITKDHLSIIEECTYCFPETYYSYRYNKTDKRQGGFIGLP
jgi:YfiH family protein